MTLPRLRSISTPPRRLKPKRSELALVSSMGLGDVGGADLEREEDDLGRLAASAAEELDLDDDRGGDANGIAPPLDRQLVSRAGLVWPSVGVGSHNEAAKASAPGEFQLRVETLNANSWTSAKLRI